MFRGDEMKYTRLDLKKRKKDNMIFLVTIVLTLILAFVIGTVIFNVFIKGHSIAENNNEIKNAQNVSNSNGNKSEKVFKFSILQCGLYSKKENADETISKLSGYGKPFIVEENKKYKVLMGIYEDGKEKDILNKLSQNSIEVIKKSNSLNTKDTCDMEIGEILNAQIKVINKLSENNVQSYKSEDLKKWTTNLKQVDKSSKNYALLKEIKDYINKLPKEISKDKVGEIQNFVYKQISKFQKFK